MQKISEERATYQKLFNPTGNSDLRTLNPVRQRTISSISTCFRY
jgi:hypothetical protein